MPKNPIPLEVQPARFYIWLVQQPTIRTASAIRADSRHHRQFDPATLALLRSCMRKSRQTSCFGTGRMHREHNNVIISHCQAGNVRIRNQFFSLKITSYGVYVRTSIQQRHFRFIRGSNWDHNKLRCAYFTTLT
jgi:hypothetical protein